MRHKQIVADLKRHEGLRLHAYQDHLGYWTIGYGRLIDKARGGGISETEAETLLENDIDRVASRLQAERGFRMAPDSVKRALVNMGFQLGTGGLLGFSRMWAALERRDYEQAAEEALDSRWAEQTPNRAAEVAKWIKQGEDGI